MTISISQGPLPFDGDRVAASTFLEAWVSGTTINNIALDNLAPTISLVASSTNVPANNLQRLGLLWFKRGEGTLHILEEADRCDNRYTAINDLFTPIAPARAFIVEVQFFGQPGGAATIGEPDTLQTGLTSYFEDCKGRRIPFYRAQTTGMDSPTRLGYQVGIIIGSSNSLIPTAVYEWGFCNALIAAGGSNVARGAFAKQWYQEPSNFTYFLHPRAAAWTGETSYGSVGIIANTTTATIAHLAMIFKRPGVDYGWNADFS